VLNTDPGISSELLRITNSALFGITREVTSLQHAITLLGMKRVRSLVMGRYLTDSIGQAAKDTGDFSISYYWRRSLGTAVLAAKFADPIIPKYREEAFIGGLLADVGVVVMMQGLSEQYASIANDYAPMRGDDLVKREREVLDLTHADVSALVLDTWMLPPVIVEAVRHHHDKDLLECQDDDAYILARLLSGAGRIAKLLCENRDKDTVVETCMKAMETVGLDAKALPHMLEDVEGTIREFAELLHTEIIASKVYARITEIITEALAEKATAG
ncbi:MAG: HDOD domain-containing protein, partial [Phycisphaerae bacterium]